MTRPTEHELIDIATLMAQELQDFIDEAEEAGNPLPGVQALVNEWEEIYSRLGLAWKDHLPASGGNIAALEN